MALRRLSQTLSDSLYAMGEQVTRNKVGMGQSADRGTHGTGEGVRTEYRTWSCLPHNTLPEVRTQKVLVTPYSI
jgi:hypothetical protein